MSEIEDGCFRVTVHQASSTFLFLLSGKKKKLNRLPQSESAQNTIREPGFLQLNHEHVLVLLCFGNAVLHRQYFSNPKLNQPRICPLTGKS